MIRTVARRGYVFAAPVTTRIGRFLGDAPPHDLRRSPRLDHFCSREMTQPQITI
jgi:DNA-binding winged helix-turn-helix (wHTH) protein